MPRKIVPVPGIPPHEWHKHQPPSSEDSRVKDVMHQEKMASHQQDWDPQAPGTVTRKVDPQWTRGTADDPANVRRRIVAGMTQPLRAGPRLSDLTDVGGIYPHQADMLMRRACDDEPARPQFRFLNNTVSTEKAPSTQFSASQTPTVKTLQPLRHYPQNVTKPEPHGEHVHSDENKQPSQAYVQIKKDAEPVNPYRHLEKGFKPADTTRDLEVESQREAHDRLGNDLENLKIRPHPDNDGESPKTYCQIEKDPDPVPPAAMRSPDLTTIQIPRPNRNYVASVRSVQSVLSLNEADEAPDAASAEQSQAQHSDIRAKMGLENKLRMTGGKLINMKIWGEMPTKPDYEVFLDPVYANPWIEDYVEHQIDYDVRANFLYETDPIEHCHCDVNTFNGELLKPVQYDYTVPDYMNSEDMDRQMTRTASLYVKRKAIKASKNNKSGPFRPSPGWVETPTPMATEAPGPSSQDKVPSSKRADAAVSVKSDLNKFSPKVPCHLRPARKEDMEDVRAIYNWEVANGIQALDVEPLSLADFEGILKKTEEAKMPFIVAVSGAYQSQWSSSQNHIASATQDGTGKILAFGFLTLRQPGLAGSFTGTGRASAKAHVFVHPEYRRKRLGHVCLDKILSTVSTRYSTKGGYEFVNLDDNPTYKYPWQHDRKFYLVSIEFMVPRKQEYGQGKFVPDETELKWFEGFLKRYKFWKVATLDAAHRSRQSYLPEPVWLDTVMFEHICQEGLGFTSNL